MRGDGAASTCRFAFFKDAGTRVATVLLCASTLYLTLRPCLLAAGCEFWEAVSPHDANNQFVRWLHCIAPNSFLFSPRWGVFDPEEFSTARAALYSDYCRKYGSTATVDVRNLTLSWQTLRAMPLPPRLTGVPRILHQMHQSRAAVPTYLEEYVASCHAMSKGWVHVFWEDADFEPFLKSVYPAFWPIFDRLQPTIHKIDSIRYAILREYGGVYLDADVRCMKPLDSWLHHYKANASVLIEPIHIMASPRGHRIWRRAMEHIAKDPQWRIASGQLLEQSAKSPANHQGRVLIDTTSRRAERLFTASGHLQMLGVSTWHWRHERDAHIGLLDRGVAIATGLAVLLLVKRGKRVDWQERCCD